MTFQALPKYQPSTANIVHLDTQLANSAQVSEQVLRFITHPAQLEPKVLLQVHSRPASQAATRVEPAHYESLYQGGLVKVSIL